MNADVKAGGMGVSEWMMMILIAIFGIVQEFLIYIFTPKAVIDRKLLSQVSQYLKWKDEVEKERFLISVYKDYVGDGIINREDYEAKCKKCVELMEDTIEDDIARYSKKQKPHKDEVSEMTELLKQYQAQIEKLKRENAKLASPETVAESPKIDLSNPIKDLAIEVPLDKPNFPDYIKQKAIFVGDSKKESDEDFSEEVDKAVAEIDDLLKEE
jgi:hypothetical protein